MSEDWLKHVYLMCGFLKNRVLHQLSITMMVNAALLEGG